MKGKMDLKNIHIGELIHKRWKEQNIPLDRVCNFFKCEEKQIKTMLKQKDISTEILLKWSKLLEYDFFRLYSQHLLLYAQIKSTGYKTKSDKSEMPKFRKSIYTKEIIDYLLGLIYNKEKTASEVIKEYKIPKTTLYRWIQKYPLKKQ